MALKINDKVKLNPASEWNDGSNANPINQEGTIREIYKDAPAFRIYVKWDNGAVNAYNEVDLLKTIA